MVVWARRGGRTPWHLVVAVLVGGLGLAGCGKQSAPSDQSAKAPDSPPTSAPAGATAQQATPPAPAQPSVATAAPTVAPAVAPAPAPAVSPAATPAPDDRLHQPFAKATRGPDDPPDGCDQPPDQTVTGKPVFKLYSEVVRLWDTIRFVTPDGKPLHYSATLVTDLGNIDIDLRSDLAPNHVRNFIALARAGYYEGLRFDRLCHEESPDQPGTYLDQVEAGCPLGTGTTAGGSIGYWLNPEFPPPDAKVSHQEGTVGACHGIGPDTAACRFYINLCKAPYLDGNYTVFGQVTQGLDVARKILTQPAAQDEPDDAHRRPEKPVIIHKVIIHTQPTEAP